MRDVFVVFEPLNHMFKVIMAAKARGYSIAIMHSMPLHYPPPFEEAEHCIDMAIPVSNWTDHQQLFSALTAIENQYRIAGTYAAAEITLVFDAKVREKHGLPTTRSEVIAKYLNKYQVRKTLVSAGLSGLLAIHGDDVTQLNRWPFPAGAYFKPCSGAGSTRVSLCHSIKEVRDIEACWMDKADIFPPVLKSFIEQHNDYFLEQAAGGELVSVESLVYKGRIHILGLSSRSLLAKNPTIEMGACFPYHHPQQEAIYSLVRRAHAALQISHGPTHTELIVSPQGTVEIVEVNLRMAGSDMLLVINAGLKADIEHQLVNLSLGQPPQLASRHDQHISSMQLVLAPPQTQTFESIEFPSEVHFYRQLKPAGTVLQSTDTEGDYVGSFIVSAQDHTSLQDKIKQIRDHIKINQQSIAGSINSEVIIR